MNEARLVKLGLVAIVGVAIAVAGGLAIAHYATGGATSDYAATPDDTLYAREKPLDDPARDPGYLGAGVAPASTTLAPPPPADWAEPQAPVFSTDDDLGPMPAADVDVPPPTSILPDGDVAEDAAATGDTAKVAAPAPAPAPAPVPAQTR